MARAATLLRGEAGQLSGWAGGSSRLRPSLSLPNPLKGMGETESQRGGTTCRGRRPTCPNSLFKGCPCDTGIFLPLIELQTTPSSSLTEHHEYSSSSELEKQSHSPPFAFISSSCCVWRRLVNNPSVPSRAWVAGGHAVIPVELYFVPV